MRIAGVALLAGTLGIAACGRQPAQPPQQQTMAQAPSPVPPGDAAPDTVHGFMIKRVDPYADTIWGIGNAAFDADARIDPAKISPQGWRVMEATAVKMADAAQALGRLRPLRVLHPGERIADEGNPYASTGARVQTSVDADPDLFRSMAGSLEQHGRDLAVAARARDTATAGRLIDEFDGVCEACHLQFWYPQDRKLLIAISKR